MHQKHPDDSHRPGRPPAPALHRLLLVTDTWHETNGVTTTLRHTVRVAAQRGYDISLLHPGLFRRVTNPFYPQYRHAVPTPWRIRALLDTVQPGHGYNILYPIIVLFSVCFLFTLRNQYVPSVDLYDTVLQNSIVIF